MDTLNLIGDWVKWLVEKTAMPVVMFYLAFRVSRQHEVKAESIRVRERFEGEERRSDEMAVRMQEEFSKRWDNIERYWTAQNQSLRADLTRCLEDIATSRQREDECERREDALQLRLTKFRRWGVQMVTVWNLQFPEHPMELPPENGQ